MPRTKERAARVWWGAACLLILLAVGDTLRSTQPSVAKHHAGGTADESSVVTAELLRTRALRLFELGEVGQAIDVATTAVEIAPGEARSWAVLGSLHSVAGHADEARASFARCAQRATSAAMDECTAGVE